MALLPLYVYSKTLAIAVPVVMLITFLLVLAPAWIRLSTGAKLTAGILGYPGTFLIGGWPVSVAPGILAMPFGWWYPAPLMTITMHRIGNTRGFEASILQDGFALAFWILLMLGLTIYSLIIRGNRNSTASDQN